MEERPLVGPVFSVNSPAVNPFVSPGSVAFIKTDDHLDLQWVNEMDGPASRAGEDLGEEFIARSRCEAERHPDSARAHTNLGAAFMASGHLDEAVEAFQTALKFNKLHYAAIAHLARARFLRNELAEAGRLADLLSANFSRNAVGQLLKGCIAARQGRVDDAVRDLKVAVAFDEKSALPRFLLGMVLLGVRRDREAITHLREATRLDDRSPALQRGLGVAYASRGDFPRAIKALKTSLTLDRNSEETAHALGRVPDASRR